MNDCNDIYQALNDLWEEYACQSGVFGDDYRWEELEDLTVIERVKRILSEEDGAG